jgi:hypothetical protein
VTTEEVGNRGVDAECLLRVSNGCAPRSWAEAIEALGGVDVRDDGAT